MFGDGFTFAEPVTYECASDLWNREILYPDGTVHCRDGQVAETFEEFAKRETSKPSPETNMVTTTIVNRAEALGKTINIEGV